MESSQNPSEVANANRSIVFLEVLAVFAVGLTLAVVVIHSGQLSALNHGGFYLFSMLVGLSSFVLSVALMIDQMKEQPLRLTS